MSEKLDKLRASLEKERERRIKINTRMHLPKHFSQPPTGLVWRSTMTACS